MPFVYTFFLSSILNFSLQMTRTMSFKLFALMLTVTGCLAAISEVKNNNPVTQKPGRFLSLPVVQKCSQSKSDALLI